LSALDTTNQTAALTAALEVVNEQLAWDMGLRQSLQRRFQELASLTTPLPRQKVDLGPKPTPISGRGVTRFSGFVKLNPYNLLEEYGADQLRAALMRSTQRDLREAVDAVQEREPGTRPASRTRNADMIDYIVEHVAGSGY
jgi:hypothetical protein